MLTPVVVLQTDSKRFLWDLWYNCDCRRGLTNVRFVSIVQHWIFALLVCEPKHWSRSWQALAQFTHPYFLQGKGYLTARNVEQWKLPQSNISLNAPKTIAVRDPSKKSQCFTRQQVFSLGRECLNTGRALGNRDWLSKAIPDFLVDRRLYQFCVNCDICVPMASLCVFLYIYCRFLSFYSFFLDPWICCDRVFFLPSASFFFKCSTKLCDSQPFLLPTFSIFYS